jgi:hypothetical protein
MRKSGGMLKMNLYEIFRWILVKQIVRTTSGLKKMKEWTLWGVDPLENKRRNLALCKSRIHGSTGHPMSYSPHCCVYEIEREESLDDCVGRERKGKKNFLVDFVNRTD